MKKSAILQTGLNTQVRENIDRPAMCIILRDEFAYSADVMAVYSYMVTLRVSLHEGYPHIFPFARSYLDYSLKPHTHDVQTTDDQRWQQYYFFMIFDLARKGE